MGTRPDTHHEGWPSHPLEAARRAFGWLTRGPEPLSIDGRCFDHLPARNIPLDELGRLLLSTGCPREVWDQVWRHVIDRSRRQDPSWTIAAVGLALPMLTRTAAGLTARFAQDPRDIHAEVLTGFLHALATIDVTRAGIVNRLRWAAYNAGYRALIDAIDAPRPVEEMRWQPPPLPSGHPDLVLARAVTAGILTQTEATLIGQTRLEDTSLIEWAAAHHQSYGQTQRSRHRAEQRLHAWLGEQAKLTPRTAHDDPTPHLAANRLALRSGPDTPERSRRVANDRV